MRVLYLTHRLPYAPNRGDRIRSYHLLAGLRQAFDVDLVSLVHDGDEAARASEVSARGITVSCAPVAGVSRWLRVPFALAGPEPLTHVLLDAPALDGLLREVVTARRPDVVVAFCSGMAKFALRPPLVDIPLVLDMVDVDSQKWRRLAEVSPAPKHWVYRREARVLADFERQATTHAVTALVINEKERKALAALAPGADVRVLPNGVDVDDFKPVGPAPPSRTVVFCGVMNYAPNEAGATWLAAEVWPRVVASHPDAQLEIVGSQPSAAVRALAAPGITVTGAVPHTRDHLWRAAVSVAPLHTARGLQNKVLEALAAGVPVVTTNAVREGLPDDVASGCAVADDPEAFARAVVKLLDLTPGERRTIAAGVDLTGLSWQAPRAQLVDLVRTAAGRRA
ncbi:MAG TPA: TIGR03087 family PEP-CTERM/XrtA system glycosyltransferase [Vicinamibacterales bacterium]|nr:TIGR03087 family PEP-CTERM/XrtA system glycosyltransferase [Vicinamibacterales bacterium]